jgi:hypothetical protein
MKNKRIFKEEELNEMGERTLDLVLKAIDSGDKEKAGELARRMYREFNYLHDGYMFWVTGLQTYIYEKYGIEALEEAERKAHTIEGKIVFTPPEKTDLRSRVESLVSGLRGHLQPISIDEDDEKISLMMLPCGSGERLIQKGGYEAGLARVKAPHRITWGMRDFPVYCVHCPVMEMLDLERSGDFNFSHIIPDSIGKGCRFVFFKDTADIPEDHYTRIGKRKPGLKSK